MIIGFGGMLCTSVYNPLFRSTISVDFQLPESSNIVPSKLGDADVYYCDQKIVTCELYCS